MPGRIREASKGLNTVTSTDLVTNDSPFLLHMSPLSPIKTTCRVQQLQDLTLPYVRVRSCVLGEIKRLERRFFLKKKSNFQQYLLVNCALML